MRLLILGSEGFIGSHCVKYFKETGAVVWGVDLFESASQNYFYTKVSRLSPEFDEMLEATAFDAVINAAGSGNVPYSMTHPLSDFEANCLDTIRVLDAIRRHSKECKYIHLSSAAVYGNPRKLPISEEDQGIPLSPYGWHKWVSEQLCKEYTSVYQLKTAIIRPFSVYGPGLKKQFFWDMYQKINAGNGSIELFGTGKESRDYIYIHDLIIAIDLVLKNAQMNAEVYNIASGEETTINEAASIFFRALEVETDFKFNNKVREGDPLNWRADVTKLKGLGFRKQYTIETGLSQLADWMKSLRN